MQRIRLNNKYLFIHFMYFHKSFSMSLESQAHLSVYATYSNTDVKTLSKLWIIYEALQGLHNEAKAWRERPVFLGRR